MYKEDKKTNMGRKQIYFKLPEDLLQVIQVKADSEQTSATEIVRKALTSYLSPETERLKELEQDVANNTEHIFFLSEQISKISKKLEEKNFSSNTTVKEVKSLRPTHRSTKPHNVTYGWGQAASTYPGWEASAKISYVKEQFDLLNTDEARAAFADKWLGLCVQSLKVLLPICYKLLSIMEDKKMYKLPHWMEGNRTYISFEHYLKYRFNKLFESWLEMEQTHKFIANFCPEEIRSKLLPIEEDGELDQKFHIDAVEGTIDAVISLNGGEKRNQEDTEQLTKLVINGIQEMTTKEVVNFCGLSKNQVNNRRKGGKLPIEMEVEGVIYSIDYKRRNLWLVKQKDAKANSLKSSKSLPYLEKQPQPIEIKSELTQTALSKKLGVNRKTLKSKQTKLSESEFADWTASKDPDDVAWVYSDTLKKYHPLN